MLDTQPLTSPPVRPAEREVWFYTRLLQLYPSAFRRAYGRDMVILFRDCRRDANSAGKQGKVWLWLHILADIGVSAPRAHLEELKMTASHTLLSQVGALLAVICAVILVNLVSGFIDIAAPGVGLNTLAFTLLGVGWFMVVFTLYRRIAVVAGRADLTATIGLGVGVITFLLIGVGTILYVVGDANAGAWASFGLLFGLLSIAMMGISTMKLPALGSLRFAPLLAWIPTVLLVVVWGGFWNELLALAATLAAVFALLGTGALLWAKAK